ncbi:type II toxin-antitoxin system RelB/DinJ family antitoxin [Faecalibaculum rodentium]|uniref:type II toxin-antitoxin system RelB/DinJ family antitoxin n=1 Tax=Faecalibaculum rodentium TaxID=1702221 RepID=UPI00339D09CC
MIHGETPCFPQRPCGQSRDHSCQSVADQKQQDQCRKGVAYIIGQAIITARVSEQDKAEVDVFCSSVGLNTSAAVSLFIKAVLRENRIPFEIRGTHGPFYSDANLAHVRRSVDQLREGKGTAYVLIDGERGKKYGQMKHGMIIDTGSRRTGKP